MFKQSQTVRQKALDRIPREATLVLARSDPTKYLVNTVKIGFSRRHDFLNANLGLWGYRVSQKNQSLYT